MLSTPFRVAQCPTETAIALGHLVHEANGGFRATPEAPSRIVCQWSDRIYQDLPETAREPLSHLTSRWTAEVTTCALPDGETVVVRPV